MNSALPTHLPIYLSVRPPVICTAHYFLLVFCMKLGFNQQKKLTKTIFSENFLLYPNEANGAFLDPTLIFFLNLHLRFFWNSTWQPALKLGKGEFWIFKENYYYPQNGKIGRSWPRNHYLFYFSLNLFIRFFWNYTWW